MNNNEVCTKGLAGNWPYSTLLQCFVKYIAPGALPGVVNIALPEGNSTSMDGAIKVCELIFPGCHEINVSQDRVSDVIYLKRDGQWSAYWSRRALGVLQ